MPPPTRRHTIWLRFLPITRPSSHNPASDFPLAVRPQSQALCNKRAHGFRAATPLPQPFGWYLHPVDVIPFVADNKRYNRAAPGMAVCTCIHIPAHSLGIRQ
jgi:hypothetical protein